jgi:A/G-specific adenine glycosylase
VEPASLPAIRSAVEDRYAAGHRSFPWRATRDPWAVLVSEVMLQQTQAARVAERFPPFLARYPTPASLATASPAEVLAAWSGLGYNRRALALRQAATRVARNGWPSDVDGLSRLPGIGPYTARAVASLAFGVPVGPVDTNVRRWLVRRFALGRPTARKLQELADALASLGAGDSERIAAWTHATMEFGARVCTARSPRCAECPIADGCPASADAPHVPVPRQPRYAGSRRQARGAIVRWLSQADGHVLAISTLRRRVRDRFGGQADTVAAFAELLGGLERAGLVHRARSWIHLGPPSKPGEEWRL